MGLQGYNPSELVEILTPYFCLRGNCGFTPGRYTSTDWDGDAKAFDSSGIIDLSAVFDLPAGVKAVAVNFIIKDETVGVHASLHTPGDVTYAGVWIATARVNGYLGGAGIVVCDASGDIAFYQSQELDEVWIMITGYWC